MKQNFLESVIGFILKYTWVFCTLLIVLELLSVTYTANILMQQSASSVMQSVSGELSGRVDGVLRLLNGFASDEQFTNTKVPLWDRVIHALPYQKSYNLYMIAMTDENVNVISADEAEPYGGDEFILVLSSISEKKDAEIIQNLCTSLNITVTTKAHTFSIHGSIGVSFFPKHGTSLEDLICKADLALYSAKQNGKNQCAFYKENKSLF